MLFDSVRKLSTPRWQKRKQRQQQQLHDHFRVACSSNTNLMDKSMGVCNDDGNHDTFMTRKIYTRNSEGGNINRRPLSTTTTCQHSNANKDTMRSRVPGPMNRFRRRRGRGWRWRWVQNRMRKGNIFMTFMSGTMIMFLLIASIRCGHDITARSERSHATSSSKAYEFDTLNTKEISMDELLEARNSLRQARDRLTYPYRNPYINLDRDQDQDLGQQTHIHEKYSYGPKPLRTIDRMQYTVRINTWRRNKELMASVHHLRTCPNIAQIQVIWCDDENDPPSELLSLAGSPSSTTTTTTATTAATNDDTRTSPQYAHVPDIVVEYHTINSLNERFNLLIDPPTYGILSIDDDVVRPCLAMDAGFYKWTDHYNRMVGYDPRLHLSTPTKQGDEVTSISTEVGNQKEPDTIHDDAHPTWSYGYLSHTQRYNQYSLTLPRFCFVHYQYLELYTRYTPQRILRTIDKQFNCEDIGLSFFVSALTNGDVPLLSDHWTISTMVKLSSGKGGGISDRIDHKTTRDKCVDVFGYLLGLKDGYHDLDNDNQGGKDEEEEEWGVLKPSPILPEGRNSALFGIGADVHVHDNPLREDQYFVPSRNEFVKKIKDWMIELSKTQRKKKQRMPQNSRNGFVGIKKELEREMESLGLHRRG